VRRKAGVGGIDFTTLYETERDGMARSLLVIGGDAEAARDAVAEAFSRAYERWPRVAAMDSPGGWVYRVALNDLRRRMRRRALESRLLGRERPRPIPPPDIDPELWDAVGALPGRQREAIVLRYVGDLTERDVAGVLGISEGAASAALVAARRRLAEQVTDRKEANAQ
jgi:RNA polymerase sigma-70 factor, ECF subfamily